MEKLKKCKNCKNYEITVRCGVCSGPSQLWNPKRELVEQVNSFASQVSENFFDWIKSVLKQVKTFFSNGWKVFWFFLFSDNRHPGASRPGCVRSAPRHERCGKSLEPGFSRWGKNNKSDFFKNDFLTALFSGNTCAYCTQPMTGWWDKGIGWIGNLLYLLYILCLLY